MATTTLTLRCAWCRQSFARPPRATADPEVYCSRLHQDFAHMVAEGKFPVVDCPRCGRNDLRIAAPDWAICQTCGYQTDRPELATGPITPSNMNRDMSETRERLAISDRRIRR